MPSCVNKISKDITFDCKAPLVGGYTGRGVLIPWEDVTGVTTEASNPRQISAITLASSGKVVRIDAVGAVNPMEGSTTAGSADSGFIMFNKTVSGRIYRRGADISADLVEPLVKSAEGFIAVLEKKDKVGDGSFEVIGISDALRCTDPASVVRTEAENGGSIAFALSCTEGFFEASLYGKAEALGETAYSAAKKIFEGLWSKGME